MNGSQTIQISKSDSQTVSTGAAENFTGAVTIKALFPAHQPAHQPARTTAGKVTFQPGARTVWHTHPYGQALIVTDGSGRVRQWGGPLMEINRGDVVWFPVGAKHWHGASPDQSMTHIAIQEELDGGTVEWLEQVTDDQYNGQ